MTAVDGTVAIIDHGWYDFLLAQDSLAEIDGHGYYPLHGSRVALPTTLEDAPSPDYLRWHNEQVYRAF